MSERDEILARLRAALPDLKRRYPIASLGLFGSIARNEANAGSDLDLLVEFERPVSLSLFLALEGELASIARRKVDLVSRPALKPFTRRHVMLDLVPV
ncbi:MAG: nucleotidyltransferase family protein [Stellaceae bacterium]